MLVTPFPLISFAFATTRLILSTHATTPHGAARFGAACFSHHTELKVSNHRTAPQDLGGTTRDRLIVLAESAVRGLNIPNFPPTNDKGDGSKSSKPSKMTRQEAEEYVGTSPALSEEEAFREFLEREVCVCTHVGVKMRPALKNRPRAVDSVMMYSILWGSGSGSLFLWSWCSVCLLSVQ